MNSDFTSTPQYTTVTQEYFANTHYGLLNLHPSASVIDIRRAYRELSKLYHPDTTDLHPEEAKQHFQRLNEAYGILANPETRLKYDLQIGYSRWNVIQRHGDFSRVKDYDSSKSAYLDPCGPQSGTYGERPLSSGELFALLLMGLTLVGCMILAFTLAWWRTSHI